MVDFFPDGRCHNRRKNLYDKIGANSPPGRTISPLGVAVSQHVHRDDGSFSPPFSPLMRPLGGETLNFSYLSWRGIGGVCAIIHGCKMSIYGCVIIYDESIC